MDKRIKPYKTRKQTVKRERIIMLTSSAFVMAALTLTGLYMKEQSVKEQDNGYSIDLTELDNTVDDKYAQLQEEVQTPIQVADNTPVQEQPVADTPIIVDDVPTIDSATSDHQLDYLPGEDIEEAPVAEVGSGLVEIPGLTDVVEENLELVDAPEIAAQVYHFTEDMGLYVPIANDIMMHYNMDSTVYFATLDQYKYNPAVIFKANEGSEVFACADAQVAEIYQNEELGQAMVLDLGNGYRATYGQLKNVNVAVGDTVTKGQMVANVSAPTKYYSVEGYNLYFGLEKDGMSVNPEELMK